MPIQLILPAPTQASAAGARTAPPPDAAQGQSSSGPGSNRPSTSARG